MQFTRKLLVRVVCVYEDCSNAKVFVQCLAQSKKREEPNQFLCTGTN